MRICYYGSYDLSEPHNSTFLWAIRKRGLSVTEIGADPLKGRASAERFRNPGKLAAFLFRFFLDAVKLFSRLWRAGKQDAVIVGYPGYFDLPLAAVFCRLKGLPLFFNIHISLYETLVLDRKIVCPNSPLAVWMKFYDRMLMKLCNAVIVDTNCHGEFYSRLYGISADRFYRVFIGADDEFKPVLHRPKKTLVILFYGSFIPLQGIEYIIRAASLLRGQSALQFEIIGRGQCRDDMLALAARLRLKNVHFVEWVERPELVKRIGRADICLGGQFGTSKKADLVIGYKCYQMMACGKPLIVSASRGNRELLTHMHDCYMCSAGSAHSLADAILVLAGNPELRSRLGKNALKTYRKECSDEQIGLLLHQLIAKHVAGGRKKTKMRHFRKNKSCGKSG